jgi:hypothetical protein
MQSLLTDTELLADLGESQSLGEVGLGLSQLGDNLFGRGKLDANHGCFLLRTWFTFSL